MKCRIAEHANSCIETEQWGGIHALTRCFGINQCLSWSLKFGWRVRKLQSRLVIHGFVKNWLLPCQGLSYIHSYFSNLLIMRCALGHRNLPEHRSLLSIGVLTLGLFHLWDTGIPPVPWEAQSVKVGGQGGNQHWMPWKSPGLNEWEVRTGRTWTS